MDIEEIRKLAQNKIKAEALTKQVRDRIKTTIWEKQNLREGFRESFKPCIEQFEKPEDYDDKLKKEEDKTKNLFTQNAELIKNQLALTAGLKENQKAITDGLEKIN